MEMRAVYRKKLRAIIDDMLTMSSMVGKNILRSVEALKNRDMELARQIMADDQNVNSIRFKIEEDCIQLIATQQPMASDLRGILAGVLMTQGLERIGDYAVGNARVVVMIGNEPPLKPLIDIPRMAEKAVDMLNRAMAAAIHRDVEAAKKIAAEDDEVDALYHQVFRELLTYMMEDPRNIARAERLLWVAHNLERAADRVTNICERVIFVVTGKMEEIGTSKY